MMIIPIFKTTEAGKVLLYLPNETRGREIGWFENHGSSFHCVRIPEKHLLRKTRSYGFNYHFFKNASFRSVFIHFPSGETLTTSRLHILRHGKLLHFKEQGFEKQIFLSVSEFGIVKAHEIGGLKYERPKHFKNNQLNLF
jgi:hypothetical protein